MKETWLNVGNGSNPFLGSHGILILCLVPLMEHRNVNPEKHASRCLHVIRTCVTKGEV